jgi:hypothetical protein
MANPQLQILSSSTVQPADTPAPDPFDLNLLRLDQSFVEAAGVKKLLTTVPVRRPNPQDFIRVYADTEYRAALALNRAPGRSGSLLADARYCSPTSGRVRDGDALHDDQPPRRRVSLAGQAATTRRSDRRVAPIGGGSGRTGNAKVDTHEGQHDAGRL